MLNTKVSIQTFFTLKIFAISFFTLLITIFFTLIYTINNQRDSFVSQSKLQSALSANLLLTALASSDKTSAKENKKIFDLIPNINHAIIFDAKDKIFTSYKLTTQELPKVPIHQEKISFTKDNIFLLDFGKLDIWYPLTQNNIQYGMLYIQYNTFSLNSVIKGMLVLFVLFSIILILILALASKSLSKHLLKPIFNLIDAVRSIRKARTYDTKLNYHSHNEIGGLYGELNALFTDLGEQQKNLKSLNEKLEERVLIRTKDLVANINELKRTQSQLVESEKMAALGSLVSGVAHEVNTPLGNALTGASIIQDETKNLYKSFHENNLKKSSLERSINTIKETSDLLVNTIVQAANLIRSFKRISVDQTHEEIRTFNFYEYVQEIFLTFHNKLKQLPVHIDIIGDKNLIVYSYPGIFSQILNNLIQNALIHAFPKGYKNATISLSFEEKEEKIFLIFKDNGIGVDPKIIKTAFEPFVTTKRNAGGTGLGLNIIYNIVSQKLKGEISMQSSQGKGTQFTIIIPLIKDIR